MATELERRVHALEARNGGPRPHAHLSDDELTRRILRLHLEREPTAEELREWIATPPLEAERRNTEMMAELRRQLRSRAMTLEKLNAAT